MVKRSFLEKLGDVVFILTCVGLLSAAVYRAVRGASVDASRIGSPALLPTVDFSASAVSVVQLTPSLARRGTPTLLVVDASGHILGAWSGVLDEQQQNEVRTLIAG
jgi:hypothetical protein